MVFDLSRSEQQGQYRYNPDSLKTGGPARIFPHAGEDGVLRYILTELRLNLTNKGQVSQPFSMILEQLEKSLAALEEGWSTLTTFLADVEFLHEGLLNFNLPPNEQFNSDFIKLRKEMAEALRAAINAAEEVQRENRSSQLSITEQAKRQREKFYEALEKKGRSRPQVSLIHEREGGLSDREFTRQRLAGPNPMILRRLQQPEKTVLESWASSPSYQLVNGESLDLINAATANRLFIADYPLLDQLTAADLQVDRFVPSPKALFYNTGRKLEPILIQLEPGGIFTPATSADADEWMRAKLYFQVADITHHELIDHLCYTHLAMEAFTIATSRQLPSHHPFYRLIKPHFQFLLAINTRSNAVLLDDAALVDNLMAPTREVSLDLINQAYRQRPFSDYALPNDIKNRGVSSEFLAEFPYRDDALLLWNAIAKYVSAYLQRYYRDDQAVSQDPYLQAWAAELGAPLNTRSLAEFPQKPAWLPSQVSGMVGLEIESLPDFPRVPGFSAQITTLQQLIDIATQIIFTSGPQHAAVNFNQFDYAGYVPNFPLAAHARPDVITSTEEMLPSVEKDLQQMKITFALSGIFFGELGRSDLMGFVEDGDRKILANFQAELLEIEKQIKTRNQQRLSDDGVDYRYLLPSQIPNSINI
ncbi:lipoxygenase family protein [Limnoraphis robusta]|uniref:Lipoxygenase family protein n=1 Tax=Limnoraphis robusta CCNP1315 TaxID=3110306 RepID=A0ABU5TWK1_9CYAN|nr:lipoxygenase family protein [Limnoraphis robusta]MEA5519254.1 lipoxygenase family protein [Limnoraphis robusta CCNP1315]MEA5547123.1 lipoxygenase family protein [Limnoraphis robusta CCNP1324]